MHGHVLPCRRLEQRRIPDLPTDRHERATVLHASMRPGLVAGSQASAASHHTALAWQGARHIACRSILEGVLA